MNIQENTRYRTISVPDHLRDATLYACTERGVHFLIKGHEYNPNMFDWWALPSFKEALAEYETAFDEL